VPAATNTLVPTATNTLVPTATNTLVPTATNTLVPTATKTSVPAATNTLVPTATKTSVPAATNTSVPAATNTPKPAPTNTPVPTQVSLAPGLRVMRVEYADYANSRAEVPTWTKEMQAAGINMVALAAGRAEWTYFKWAGHTADQSSDVTDTGIDFLAEDSATYGQFAKVDAVIDVFSPNYILANPSTVAINALGQPDPNLVSTSDLVNGAFGQASP